MSTVNHLIQLNGLSGETASALARSSRESFAVKRDVEESLFGLLGGSGAGLLGGLCADLLSGGMTLGGGAIAGMIVGGATTYALAKGYNLTQTGQNMVRWSEAQFLDQVKSIHMLYLAVSHFGRGRGAWQDPVNNPAHWQKVVDGVMERKRGEWHTLWGNGGIQSDADVVSKKLTKMTRASLESIFTELYPDSDVIFRLD